MGTTTSEMDAFTLTGGRDQEDRQMKQDKQHCTSIIEKKK
jgi:hypothetical protein